MKTIAVATSLTENNWQARKNRYRDRFDPILLAHNQRQQNGRKHPVHDFLFEYYTFRPNQLRRWSPGAGIRLQGPAAQQFLQYANYTATEDNETWLNPADIPEKTNSSDAMGKEPA